MAAYRQVCDSRHLHGWLPRTGISSGTLRSVIEYGLFFIFFYFWLFTLSQKKTICNPLAHPTWKCTILTCEVPDFFYLTGGLHCTCIFRTCVFHPCRSVLAFSVHAFSILAKFAVSYLPFPYLRFQVLAFSAPPTGVLLYAMALYPLAPSSVCPVVTSRCSC